MCQRQGELDRDGSWRSNKLSRKDETKIVAWTEYERKSVLTQKSDGLPWGGMEISIKITFKTGVRGSRLLEDGRVFYQVSSINSMLLVSQVSFSPSGRG